VENLTVGERVYKAIKAGVDQMGGLNEAKYVMEAYELGVKEMGADAMKARFEQSAVRLLKNYFRIGLFENPYVEVAKAKEVVASDAAKAAGYKAQLNSIVMVKNDNNAIKAAGSDKPTVYIPMIFKPAEGGLFGVTPASWILPVDIKEASEYFTVVTDKISATLTGPKDQKGIPSASVKDVIRAAKSDLAKCDMALVVINSPANPGSMFGGYGIDKATGKYLPMTLQYGRYTADSAAVRTESLAGDMAEKQINGIYGTQTVNAKVSRSYFGNSTIAANENDLATVNYAVDSMPQDARIVVAINANNAMVFSEFESKVDAIILGFGVSSKALIEVAAGKSEPSGLLPMQMPKSMEIVEAQFEDVPRDMECYVDASGNKYDFAFGLNWSGVIKDERVTKYGVTALKTPTNPGVVVAK